MAESNELSMYLCIFFIHTHPNSEKLIKSIEGIDKDMHIVRGKYTKTISFLITVIGFTGLLAAPSISMYAAKNAVDLCLKIIVPTLFPFLVLSSVFIMLGFADAIGKKFEKVMRHVFNVSGSCGSALVLGLLSGFPIGAKIAVSLYENGLCTKSEGERVLAFCNNAGPFFVLGTVGAGIWNSSAVGWVLWGAQTIAALITGIIFGHLWKRKDVFSKKPNVKAKTVPLIKAITSSVRQSAESLIYICAFIIFFAVIISLLQHFGVIPAIAAFIHRIIPFVSSETVENLLIGVFEMTTGIASIGNQTPFIRSLTLTGAVLGWAGISVHFQVLSFVYESGLSSKPYIYGKFIQTGLCAIITFFLSFLLPIPEKEVYLDLTALYGEGALSGVKIFLICTLMALFLCAILISFIKYSKK